MAKHTQGEWIYNPDWHSIEPDDHSLPICKMLSLRNADEVKANARLIAAAPQMLEALKAIKSLVGEDGDYALVRRDGESASYIGDGIVVDTVFAKAERALAAAKGES